MILIKFAGEPGLNGITGLPGIPGAPGMPGDKGDLGLPGLPVRCYSRLSLLQFINGRLKDKAFSSVCFKANMWKQGILKGEVSLYC